MQKFKVNTNLTRNRNRYNLFIQATFGSSQISFPEHLCIDRLGLTTLYLYYSFARLLRPAAVTFSLDCTYSGRLCFLPREAQNTLASEFSFLKLLSPASCVFNHQFHCYCTVHHLCLWAWEGSLKSAHMMGQLRICIMEQPKLSLPKAFQWDCLTFRQILDIKPRVHDSFTYA